MSCACKIKAPDDGDPTQELLSQVVDCIGVVCCECKESVNRIHLEVVESDGQPHVFGTCLDCLSVRKALFCDHMFWAMWDSLRDVIEDGASISEDCLLRMTPRARGLVLELIDEQWAAEGDELVETD